MPSITEDIQAKLRSITGTALQYLEDWHAYLDQKNITRAQINERVLDLARLQDPTIRTVSAAWNYFANTNNITTTETTAKAISTMNAYGGSLWVFDDVGCFSDLSGTVPAVNNGSVAFVKDLCSTKHLTQASVPAQPIFKSVGGLFYADFDGITQNLAFASLNPPQQSTFIIACTVTSASPTFQGIMGFRDSPTFTGFGLFRTDSTSNQMQAFVGNGAFYQQIQMGAADFTNDVLALITNTNIQRVARDGNELAPLVGPYSIATGKSFTVGSVDSFFCDVNVAGIAYAPAVMSDSDIGSMELYLAKLIGTPL